MDSTNRENVNSIWERELKRVNGFQHPISRHIRDYALEIESGNIQVANRSLEKIKQFLRNTLWAEEDAYLAHFFDIFLDAIDGSKEESGNLYSENEMLEAFEQFCEKVPLVNFGYNFVSKCINNYSRNYGKIKIIDLGIGSGRQWQAFLNNISTQITLIGVDLPTSNNKNTFKKLTEKFRGTHINFVPILEAIENTDFSKFIKKEESEFLVINASLALHHILPEIFSSSGRQSVIERIAHLEPDLLTLVEPDSDHNNMSVSSTIIEAMAHYMTVFNALSEHLQDKHILSIIEQSFFGREIKNILSHSDEKRFERHERYEQWEQRLSRAGFELRCLDTLAWKEKPLLVASAWQLLKRDASISSP